MEGGLVIAEGVGSAMSVTVVTDHISLFSRRGS
jgi:hypothetical protein